jgi:WD40 repeat protein
MLQLPNLTLIRTLNVDESRDFLSLAFSPSAKWLAGAIGDKVLVYDQMTGTLSHTLTGHTDYTRSVVFSPDGKQLASSSDDNIIRLWSTDSWTLEHSLTGDSEWTQVEALAYSPDGRYLISAGCAYVVDGKCTKGNLALWDVGAGVVLVEIDAAHSTWITAMALSADGKTVATGCDNGYIKLWTLEVP